MNQRKQSATKRACCQQLLLLDRLRVLPSIRTRPESSSLIMAFLFPEGNTRKMTIIQTVDQYRKQVTCYYYTSTGWAKKVSLIIFAITLHIYTVLPCRTHCIFLRNSEPLYEAGRCRKETQTGTSRSLCTPDRKVRNICIIHAISK